MPYTLTSASTLGYDLVRLPGGRQVAGVVVSALRSGPAEWALLASHHALRTSDPAADPFLAAEDAARARELAGLAPRLTAPAPVSGTAGAAAQEPVSLTELAERLRTSLVGSAAGLEHLVRHEALEASGTAASPLLGDDDPAHLDRALAADVLADAALACYAAREVPRALRRRLCEPYVRAVAGAAPGTFDLAPDPRAPWGPALAALLDALRDLDAAGRERWRSATSAVRGERRPWAASMHSACWAAHTSGRVPAAAAAQMLAVQAFHDAGFTVDDGALGTWNAVSGCVQGLLVADLLDADGLAVLVEPWELATGRALLSA